MSLICSECTRYLSNPYLLVISVEKKGTQVEERLGYGICGDHSEKFPVKVQKDAQKLPEGLAFLVQLAFGTGPMVHDDGTIDSTAGTLRNGTPDYLTPAQIRRILPKTYTKILARDERLVPYRSV